VNAVPPLSVKERLILYLMVGMTAGIALVARVISPKFEQIFRDVFGDQAELPIFTVLVLHTASYWVFLPILLFLSYVWSKRRRAHPRLQHRVWWVVVLACMVALLLMVFGGYCLWLPFSNL